MPSTAGQPSLIDEWLRIIACIHRRIEDHILFRYGWGRSNQRILNQIGFIVATGEPEQHTGEHDNSRCGDADHLCIPDDIFTGPIA